MKLYPSYLILQQQVVSVTTIEELKELCHQLKLKVEVKFFFSTFSNLAWDLSNARIKGTFNAHVFTLVSNTDDSLNRPLSSCPCTLKHLLLNPYNNLKGNLFVLSERVCFPKFSKFKTS